MVSISALLLSTKPVAAGDPCDPLEPVQAGANLATYPFSEFSLPEGVCPSLVASGPANTIWFKSNKTAQIGKMAPDGEVTLFEEENIGDCLVKGSDGNMWFNDRYNYKIAKITPDGVITYYDLLTAEADVSSCVLGADGNVWFTQNSSVGSKVAKVTPTGNITEYDIIDQEYDYYNAAYATLGPGGNIWLYFSAEGTVSQELLSITPSGVVTRYDWPLASGFPTSMWGTDDKIWFAGSNDDGNFVGKITPDGEFTTYQFGNDSSTIPRSIAQAADGTAWFTVPDVNKVGHITEGGSVNLYELSSPSNFPYYLTADADGNIWFGELAYNKLAKISVASNQPSEDSQVTVQSATGGAAISLTPPNGATVAGFQSVNPTSLPADRHDVTYDYPLGLVSFTLDDVEIGSTQTIQLAFETNLKPEEVVPRKFNATSSTYLDIPGVVVTETSKDGKPTLLVSYTITDGGSLDQDGQANGTIVDPVGLAVEHKGLLANTGVMALLGLPIGLIMVFAGTYTYIDYRKHKRPLIESDRELHLDNARQYTYWHHLRVVSIPLLKYRLIVSFEKKQDPQIANQ